MYHMTPVTVSDINLSYVDQDIDNILSGNSWFFEKVAFLRGIFNYRDEIHLQGYNHQCDMARSLQLTLPNWVVGVGTQDTIHFIKQESGTDEGRLFVGKLIVHEMVHCILHRLEISLPCWLNEGLAVYISEQSISSCNDLTNASTWLNELNYNSDGFYIKAAALTRLLVNKYGLAYIIERLGKEGNSSFITEHDVWGIIR